ncbi:MAG: GIY-YIG nuclease family protein, partial [Chloroflexi bacterium]|nr:GIY-YIG nuclease family protein [Chloroflexota bacterium]
ASRRVGKARGSSPLSSTNFFIMFHVYVLKSDSANRYYIGSTKDLAQRLDQHNSGISKSTRAYRPWRLVYSQAFDTRSDAVRREKEVKSWKNRAYLESQLDLA